MSFSRAELAEAVLDTMRQHLKLSIGAVGVTRLGVGEVWRIDASVEKGERWAAEHEDYYTAVCLLAELVRFDLRE